MKPFECDKRIRRVLPHIKRAVIQELYRMGYKVKDIAKLMGMTPAAVSQYIHGKRGKDIPVEGIKELVKKMEEGTITQEDVCRVCDALAGKVS